MFSAQKTLLSEGHAIKYTLYRQEKPLTYLDFIRLLQQQEAFRSSFIELLSEISFRAYQWETPPVTSGRLDQPFEFVATNTPGIDLPPDPSPFRRYFNSGDSIAVFDNLGGDAKLVAPSPIQEPHLNYSHIGVFMEEAPEDQQHALWKRVGDVVEGQVSEQPLWLNTAGGGVAWLHIRLDSRPKYYSYRPYCFIK